MALIRNRELLPQDNSNTNEVDTDLRHFGPKTTQAIRGTRV